MCGLLGFMDICRCRGLRVTKQVVELLGGGLQLRCYGSYSADGSGILRIRTSASSVCLLGW